MRANPLRQPHPEWIVPRWPAPAAVRGLITTRAGGASSGEFGTLDGRGGMNVGFGADDPAAVRRNRERLAAALPAPPRWLALVHGAGVVDAEAVGEAAPSADASFTTRPRVVCCVTVADCLPVLLADTRARAVGIAHAGWRGLAAGVIQNTVGAMRRAIGDPRAEILAYLGPAIGPQHFEVGTEVLSAMRERLPDAGSAFRPHREDRHLADLFALARQALAQVAVASVHGGGDCTASDAARFYSYRRDGRTGRHAALIWIEPEPAR
jgi:hypothetical protein